MRENCGHINRIISQKYRNASVSNSLMETDDFRKLLQMIATKLLEKLASCSKPMLLVLLQYFPCDEMER